MKLNLHELHVATFAPADAPASLADTLDGGYLTMFCEPTWQPSCHPEGTVA